MIDNTTLETPIAAAFPLPFRVLFLGGAGILCWATNLHGLHLLDIDIVPILDVGGHDYRQQIHPNSAPRFTASTRSALTPSVNYTSVYKLFFVYTLWTFLGWTLYRFNSQDDPQLVNTYKHIPTLLSLVIIMVLVAPYNVFYRHERDRFLL